MAAPVPSSRALIVAGAVSYDYLIYPTPLHHGRQATHLHGGSADHNNEAQLVIRPGSADLVAQLLSAAAPRHGLRLLPPSLLPPAASCLRHNASSLIDLTTRGSLDSSHDRLQYSVLSVRNIGRPPIWHSPPTDQAAENTSAVLVISGSGQAFTNVEPALNFLLVARPRYVLHHMTRPLATGVIWDLIRDGPRTRDGPPESDFIAVVLEADDLRAEGIALSQSLSWEATAEDFVRNLGSNGRLDTLVTCPNLIVCFGTQGVIHHKGREATDPKLYFDPRALESDSPTMIGTTSAFTAGFALGFAASKPDNEKGIRYGIAASKKLFSTGFVHSSVDQAPDYPISETMDDIRPNQTYACVDIPSARISAGDRFSIFDSVAGDASEIARKIVTHGPDKALASCPATRFADMWTVEREEQESLRAVVFAVQERLRSSNQSIQPTSIGLVGARGSGKKFTVSSLAQHLIGSKPMCKLTYNSRLLKRDEFVAACHSIRDSTASGILTAVIFENFECVLDENNNSLLNDFLAIMRDGVFTDRGHVHSLGAPILFFLVDQDQVGSSPHDLTSPRSAGPTAIIPFNMAAAPPPRPLDDSLLMDNLHGLIHVKGPNPSGPEDKMYCIRRALMLRQMLLQKYPHLQIDGTINVEEGVLHALLLVPSYKHGLRSLEKIISTSRLSGRRKFDIAALPPEEQIQLHVDGKIFMSYLRTPKLQPKLREKLARGLFETYKKERISMAEGVDEQKALETDRSMRDWDDLSAELQESTRAQADDIPRKLRTLGCFMLEDDRSDPLVRVHAFSEEELDLLSEMEHERFNAERLQRQWKIGPRNSKQRTTPFLVPWRDLEKKWRDVDKVMVECVPRLLEQAGWRIYKTRDDRDTYEN